MDYHALTKKCDGMCDSCECPPAELADPSLKPDIAALTTRLAEDTEFAAQVTGKKFMAARISADPALLERCIKAETEAALLRVMVDELERDAARYRFVRTADKVGISAEAARDPVAYDDAIDRAMQKARIAP